jgi:hypothetical protein
LLYIIFMPPVNLYYRRDEYAPLLEDTADQLRDCVAEQLSTEKLTLTRNEVSVRTIRSLGKGMLADVEMDILAAPHPGRVERQDEICAAVRDFMLSQIPGLHDTKVWLSLQELGYSFDR